MSRPTAHLRNIPNLSPWFFTVQFFRILRWFLKPPLHVSTHSAQIKNRTRGTYMSKSKILLLFFSFFEDIFVPSLWLTCWLTMVSWFLSSSDFAPSQVIAPSSFSRFFHLKQQVLSKLYDVWIILNVVRTEMSSIKLIYLTDKRWDPNISQGR